MARTVDEVKTDLINAKSALIQLTEQLAALNAELYLATYGFYPGEPVDMDGVPGTVWFDGLMMVFQSNATSSGKVYLKDGSKLKKKV